VRLLVLQEFNGDVAEGLVGKILDDMGVPSGSKTGFAVLELESGGRLSGDIVFEDDWTQGYEDAVMAGDGASAWPGGARLPSLNTHT